MGTRNGNRSYPGSSFPSPPSIVSERRNRKFWKENNNKFDWHCLWSSPIPYFRCFVDMFVISPRDFGGSVHSIQIYVRIRHLKRVLSSVEFNKDVLFKRKSEGARFIDASWKDVREARGGDLKMSRSIVRVKLALGPFMRMYGHKKWQKKRNVCLTFQKCIKMEEYIILLS